MHMIRELVRDEAILSTPCEKATADDAQLAEDLVDTLKSLDDAVCLAANQIGETKQVAAIILGDTDADDPEILVLFNPVMKRALYPVKIEEECLTLDEPHKVTRFGKVTVAYEQLVDGKLVARKTEFAIDPAQAVQHVIDHCKGKLV